MLVGQTATLNLQLSPSTVQESVTVTGEAPLVDMRNSAVGGNLDAKQLSEIPEAKYHQSLDHLTNEL